MHRTTDRLDCGVSTCTLNRKLTGAHQQGMPLPLDYSASQRAALRVCHVYATSMQIAEAATQCVILEAVCSPAGKEATEFPPLLSVTAAVIHVATSSRDCSKCFINPLNTA